MTTVEVPLTRGYVAIVDAADADRVLTYKWYAKPHGRTVYALRTVWGPGGKGTPLTLQRFLTGSDRMDHRNGDGLDNRRCNLREATVAENNQNRRRRLDNTSGFKGVHWRDDTRRWRAVINAHGERMHLGYFASAEEAAHAYDMAARELHGEFATVNFPQPGERAA